MIKKCFLSCILVSMATVFLCSCATHVLVAKKYPVDRKMLPELSSGSMIAIDNAQQNKNEILLGTNMGSKFNGDLNQFTEVAIETLEDELKNMSIIIESNSEKRIKLSVTKVHFDSRWSGFWCVSCVRVETGDGYTAEIDGHDSNAWILHPCIYGSLNHAVVAVLNDEKIIEYINR